MASSQCCSEVNASRVYSARKAARPWREFPEVRQILHPIEPADQLQRIRHPIVGLGERHNLRRACAQQPTSVALAS